MTSRKTRRFGLVLIALLPLLVFAFVMLRLFEGQQIEAAHNLLRQTSASAANAVEQQLREEIAHLQGLAASTTLDAGDFENFSQEAERLLDVRTHWLSISLSDRDSLLINLRSEAEEVTSPESLEWVWTTQQAWVGNLVNSSERYGQPYVVVRVPVVRNGTVTHTVAASIAASSFVQLFNDHGLPSGWMVAVIDRNNVIIARSDGIIGRPMRPEYRDGLRQPYGSIFWARTLESIPSYGILYPVPVAGWNLAVAAPVALVEAPYQPLRQIVWAGGGLAAFLAVSILIFFLRWWDRTRAAEAARATGQRLAEVYASTTDGVFELDRSWRIVFINQRARDLLLGGRDVTGKALQDVFPGVQHASVFTQYERVLFTREAAEFETYYPPLQGWYLVRACPTQSGLAAYFQDITKRKHAEEALRQSEELFRTLFDTVLASVAIVESESFRFLKFNAKAHEALGYTAEEFASLTVLDIDVGFKLEEMLEIEDRLVRREQPQEAFASRQRTKDGRIIDILVSGSPLLYEGRQCFSFVWMDITPLKEAERRAEAAKEEAEHANMAKSQFLAAASHDLRQPVQSLMLLTSALSMQLENHPGRSIVGHIERATLALKNLLDGLLDVSRLDAGVVEPDMRGFCIQELLSTVASEYRLHAEEKGLSLRVVPSSLWLRSDPGLLERMLRNLIENAIKYTENGSILVGCRRVGSQVRIEVYDTGIGIPADQIEAVFEEFHQLGNPERDRSKGLGLGLSIVRRLSHLLDHPVSLKSRLGKGTCFAITVPLAASQPVAQIEQVTRKEKQGEGLAVVVEDEEGVREALSLQLAAWGFRIISGADDQEVLTALKGQVPDLIISDYRLRNGLTGRAVIDRLQRAYDHAIPSIILTGETSADSIIQAHEAGYVLLHKPLSSSALWDCVSHLSAGNPRALTEARQDKPN
ncbi:ATP-binding protein [Telmatospirillum sp. J64-1]|uniref:hybrid sensor histidine kinase/response regulator n=1 Tax=Telmatospirillum sp. J64-1 TaxID=2502183 RepID=UPI00163D8841|nr:ATP-binding protein [Telmatospirillum sp. J64-1]